MERAGKKSKVMTYLYVLCFSLVETNRFDEGSDGLLWCLLHALHCQPSVQPALQTLNCFCCYLVLCLYKVISILFCFVLFFSFFPFLEIYIIIIIYVYLGAQHQ